MNDFRIVCERTQQLFSQNKPISTGEFWSDASDQETFVKCFTLVQQFKDSIEKLYLKQYVDCQDLPNSLIDQSFDLPTEHKQDQVETDNEHTDVGVKKELAEFKLDINATEDLEEDGQCSLKSEQESKSDEDTDYAEDDSADENLNDPEQEIQEEIVYEEICEEKVSDLVTKAKRTKRPPDEPRRRRGRPALPEELLKRRRRKPGEPKKKPGPKNRIKLPAQSAR